MLDRIVRVSRINLLFPLDHHGSIGDADGLGRVRLSCLSAGLDLIGQGGPVVSGLRQFLGSTLADRAVLDLLLKIVGQLFSEKLADLIRLDRKSTRLNSSH